MGPLISVPGASLSAGPALSLLTAVGVCGVSPVRLIPPESLRLPLQSTQVSKLIFHRKIKTRKLQHKPVDPSNRRSSVISQQHLVRLIEFAVHQMSPTIFQSLHPGGGRPPYHPQIMLKAILYAYANRIYSSRQIAKQLTENIMFIWLSGEQKPDFRTINRFRSERMKDVIYETFFSIVDLLREEGLVKLEDYFLDGTKLEANVNKYIFVWKKSTEKYDKKLDEKFRQIVFGIEQFTKEDEEAEKELDFQEKLEDSPILSRIKGPIKNTTDWGHICGAYNLLKWAANTENEQKLG